jgi:flagellar biosynthetic protein FliR
MGLRMSAPFIIFGLLFNLGLGVLNRLMPAMQIFFVGLPLQILGGFVLLAASVGASMTWFLGRYEAELGLFLGKS